MKKEFKSGDIVKSNYRKHWIGIIIGVEYWSEYKGKAYPIYRVKPIFDQCGNPQPKNVKSRTLSGGWLESYTLKDGRQSIKH